MNKTIREELFMVLYRLYHLSGTNNNVYDEATYKQVGFDRPLDDENGWDAIIEVYDALKWADEHPEYDFASIIPSHTYSNEEVLYYLRRIYKILKSFLNESGKL